MEVEREKGYKKVARKYTVKKKESIQLNKEASQKNKMETKKRDTEIFS